MTTRAIRPPTLANDVLRDLKTSTTTTEGTIVLLRTLLGLDSEDKGMKAAPKRLQASKSVKAVKSSTTNGSRSNVRAKPTNNKPVEIFEDSGSGTKPLPVAGRVKLATEAFNLALRSLNDIVKTSTTGEISSHRNNNHKDANTLVPVVGPLEHRSLNRRGEQLEKKNCTDSRELEHILVADCAVLALHSLQSSGSNEDRNVVEQRQRGGLMLVDKLIALGLYEKAVELTHSLISQYAKQKQYSTSKEVNRAKHARLCNMLTIDAPIDTTSDFSFVTSLQSQMLRLTILSESPLKGNLLLEQLKLEVEGSPASNLIKGGQAGHLDKEKVGLQLRTVSQAMLKICSRLSQPDSAGSIDSEAAFHLTVQALHIKVKSWQYLGHNPHPDKEIWCHLTRAARKILGDSANQTSQHCPTVMTAFESMQGILQQNSFPYNLPESVALYLVDIAEESEQFGLALNLLDNHFPSSVTNSGQVVGVIWRKPVLLYKTGMRSGKKLYGAFHAALDTIQAMLKQQSPDQHDLSILAARLRKVSLSVITESQKTNCNLKNNQDIPMLTECSFKILTSLFALHSKPFERGSTQKASSRAEITTFAKTLEALLEVGRYAVLRTSNLQALYLDSLRSCVTTLRSLQDIIAIAAKFQMDETQTLFVEQLSIRVSNHFWQHYAELEGSVNNLDKRWSLLTDSVAVIVQCRSDVQNTASLGTKLEHLASVQVQLDQYLAASMTLEEAMRHYIAIGTLDDAADASLSCRSPGIWTPPGTKRFFLRKSLSAYVKIMITQQLCSTTSKKWYFDDVNLPAPQRFILLEAQVTIAAEHSLTKDQQHTLLNCIGTILELSSEARYRPYQTRFMLQLLKLDSKHEFFQGKTALSVALVDQVCELHYETGITPKLGIYHAWLSNALRFQWAITDDCSEPSVLLEAVRAICSLVSDVCDLAGLEAVVDDISFCLKQLELALSYAQTLGNLDYVIHCEVAICHILKLQASPSSAAVEQLVAHMSNLALTYTHQHDLLEAELVLKDAETLLSEHKGLSTSHIKWTFAFTDYLLSANDLSSATRMLAKARENFEALFPKSRTISGRARLDRDTMLSRAALLESRIAYQNNSLEEATLFSRQAIKISTSIWQAIQSSQKDCEKQGSLAQADSTIQNLSTDMSNLTISTVPSALSSMPAKNGMAFWDATDVHCSALVHIGTLMMHHGLYQDAFYYFEQLSKLASALGSTVLAYRANTCLSSLFVKAGDMARAKSYVMSSSPDDLDMSAQYNCETSLLLIETLVETGQHERAILFLEQYKKLVYDAKTKLAITKSTTRIAPATKQRAKQVRTGAMTAVPKRAACRKTAKKDENYTRSALARSTSSYLVEDKITYIEAMLELNGHNSVAKHVSVLQTYKKGTTATLPQLQGLLAKHLLEQALAEMSSDAVKCVLAETAVALPVKTNSGRVSARVSFIQADMSPVKAKAKGRRRIDIKAMSPEPMGDLSSGEQLIVDAHQLLTSSKQHHQALMTTHDFHVFGKLETKLSLFGSTMETPYTLSPLSIVLQLMQSKEVVCNRETMVSKSEIGTKDRNRILSWPEKISTDADEDGRVTSPTVSASELAVIPPSWNIISLSLTEDGTEILVSKLNADQSPFMLRIPLSRSDLDAHEEAEFTYDAAKSELETIISQTNASCHDIRGQGHKEERQAWYRERQQLDEQLCEWLCNVENVWLGGFRGLLSPLKFEESHRFMFATALTKALNKYLPSRQRQPPHKSAQVDLHCHVLDLFLGLGHPDSWELEDALTDLLYFVIDILQFSGEQNAYDEIDFDALIVEVLDALRICHEHISQEMQSSLQHTILVLDKELASFPWESLPCLQNQPISRMPSLRAIIQRAERIGSQNHHPRGYVVSSTEGACILNPSSDLVSTESTFRPIFEQHLPSFTSTIRTPPTESSFESMLQDHELLLYFGHGSGAQYIRGRSIRAMTTCAVTLLMGCSSAKMTECGQFESHGMPGYYIGGMSGCMAIVGTLWDVTDRDIDRFAVKLLNEWGLIEEDDLVRKSLAKRSKNTLAAKGTMKTKSKLDNRAKEPKDKVSLEDALSRSRNACLLRYLNGAAPVVYGVPVYLK